MKDQAGKVYDAASPKVAEDAEYVKEQAEKAYESGSENLFDNPSFFLKEIFVFQVNLPVNMLKLVSDMNIILMFINLIF